MTVTDPPSAAVPTGRRVRTSEPLHHEVVEHLEDEARLLDDGDLMGWLQLLAEDIVYRAPVRVTRAPGDGDPFETEMAHYDENAMTLFLKLMRLSSTSSAWAENPASRTRRFITNIRVHETEEPGELHVESSFLLVRSRYDDADVDLLTGRRIDRLRRTDGDFKLARRTILFDQATLGVQNLAVYV